MASVLHLLMVRLWFRVASMRLFNARNRRSGLLFLPVAWRVIFVVPLCPGVLLTFRTLLGLRMSFMLGLHRRLRQPTRD